MGEAPRTPDRQGAGADGGSAALNFTSSSLRSASASFRPQVASGCPGPGFYARTSAISVAPHMTIVRRSNPIALPELSGKPRSSAAKNSTGSG